MKTRWKIAIALIVVTGLALAGMRFWFGGDDADFEYFTATVERGKVQSTIISTGKVDAMVTVDVGSQITGQVQELYANFNSIVSEGQVIAQLDPRNYQAQLRNAEANLSSAQSRIETSRADRINADASLASARANLISTERELAQAEANLARAGALHADGLIPDTEIENVTVQLETSRARLIQQEAAVQQAEAQIIARDAAIRQADATLEQAEADLEEAQLNLGYTTIRSPVDGVVISREVDVGQTVSASTSAPTLFVIANDLSRMRVEASIDEADIGLLGQNKRVDFTVDAYPDDTFVGQIDEIRLNASTTQNVVTYGVIITFDNPDLKLKPGMTAYLTITVAERDDVLAVPNAALRWEPPDFDSSGITADETVQATPSGIGASPTSTVSSGYPGGSDSGFETSGGGSVVVPATSTAVFMPGQLWDTGEILRFQGAPVAPPRPGLVWVMNAEGEPEMREVMVGITDESRTEVVSGDLSEGDVVVVSDSLNRADEDETGNRGVFRFR